MEILSLETAINLLEQKIANGYLVTDIAYVPLEIEEDVNNPVFYLRKPDSLIERSKAVGLIADPRVKGKFIILLNNNLNQPIGIPTNSIACLERAEQQIAYQNETIALDITLQCTASGASDNPNIGYTVIPLITQINNSLGWSFKGTGINSFEANNQLLTTDTKLAEKEIERLQQFLLYLAMVRQVGIKIQRQFIANKPRYGHYFSSSGEEEWNMPCLSTKETNNYEQFLSAPKQALKIAEGLNQVYSLNSLPSRLILLWALTESTFKGNTKSLLSKEEIDQVMAVLQGSKQKNQMTKEEKERLKKIRDRLRDLKKLTRNMSISKKISDELELDYDFVYAKIKEISIVRGKCFHDFIFPDKEVREAEQCLRIWLEKFLESETKIEFDPYNNKQRLEYIREPFLKKAIANGHNKT